MKDIFGEQLRVARAMRTKSESLIHLSSIIRSLLQVTSIISLEAVVRAAPVIDRESDIKHYLDRFSMPSDGLPVEILDGLIPEIRGNVFRCFFNGWFERSDGARDTIAEEALEWVKFRNRRPAHGVLDQNVVDEWALRTESLIERILIAVGDNLPARNGSAYISVLGDVVIPLSVPLIVDGHAFVIGKVSSKKGTWRVQGQLLSWDNAKETIVDLSPDNLFSEEFQSPEKFKWLDVPVESRTKLVLSNVPVRQTTNFVGRKRELEKLREWLEDVVDSRTCLVYGDGGFGKTTLVLEFLNDLFDKGLSKSELIPSVVSFYTAKKTKWTEDGLVHFKGISDAMEDGVRELIYSLEPVIGKDWYKIEGRSLIDKVAARFSQEGFSRDDVLLIIDNTETLATSNKDSEELADFLAQVAKKLGRVIITSRRRELLAAVPVSVSQLSESEALQLIQRLGKDYGARAVVQAGEPKLRAACNELMCKPLLIDTLVRYISRSDSGIQEGLDQILKKTSDELLEFLYEDAWVRMSNLVRDVFMVLVSVASPLDGKCVGDVCAEVRVLHAEFQVSLGETYFASILDHGGTYDLEIVELAKEFFRQKKSKLPVSEKERIDSIAFKVDKLAADRQEIARGYLQDRVADGFSSDYAKAAKIATIRKRYAEAKDLYELAILEEPINSALQERFASFLLRVYGKPELAISYAARSVELDSKNADGWLTLGLVKYKLKDISGGDEAVDKAMKLGKTEQLCMLRKAIARFHGARLEPYGRASPQLLKEALGFIERALKAPEAKDYYYYKNRRESEKYKVMIQALVSRINRREIISTKV